MTTSYGTTAALERTLAKAQRLAAEIGDDELLLYTAQARLLAKRLVARERPRRGLRLTFINVLVRISWRCWDAAEALR